MSARVIAEQSVAVPNFHDGPFERLVTGFVDDGWDLIESCQEMLDLTPRWTARPAPSPCG